MLREGTKAPDFESVLDDGTTFRLSSLEGRKSVVLYFYPKDFTAGCTREACSFQENFDEVERFVGVSGDTVESHRAFREKHSLGFPLVSDPSRRIVKAYDAEGLLGFIARVTYVIDKAGVIRGVIRHDLAIQRHLPDVLKALVAIESKTSTG